MPFEVRLKAGHPTGTYRRSGQVFTGQPVVVPDEKMTKAIRTDPWLLVTEVKPEKNGKGKK